LENRPEIEAALMGTFTKLLAAYREQTPIK
jgi:hypothetical protein